MLSEQILKSNEVLKALTPEQIIAIVTLSQNDETAVIASKLREVHDKYDADVEAASGLKREQAEKSYDYVKRVLGSLNDVAKSAGDLKKERDALKIKADDLEKKIGEGKGNEAMQAKLAEVESKLRDKDNEISDWKKKHTKEVAEKEVALQAQIKKNTDILIDAEFNGAMAGIKFKEDIPKGVRDAFISNVKAQILAENQPDFIDDGKGGQRLVFRNKEGVVQNNPENQLNPYTAGEFMTKGLAEIIDTGRKQSGTGTKPNPLGNSNGSLNLLGVASKVQANQLIRDHLTARGIAHATPEFDEAYQKIMTEHNLESLPMTAAQ